MEKVFCIIIFFFHLKEKNRIKTISSPSHSEVYAVSLVIKTQGWLLRQMRLIPSPAMTLEQPLGLRSARDGNFFFFFFPVKTPIWLLRLGKTPGNSALFFLFFSFDTGPVPQPSAHPRCWGCCSIPAAGMRSEAGGCPLVGRAGLGRAPDSH